MCKFIVLLLALPLFAPAATVSSGTATIPGTFHFDFDAGTVGSAGADVFWAQYTATTRGLEPIGGASIVNIGEVDFDSLTVDQLEGLTYSSALAGIDGSDDSNLLVEGDVFGVQTNLGNFAKVLVTGPFDTTRDNGLPIEWFTYTPTSSTPEPAAIFLTFTGLATVAVIRQRS